MEKSTPVNIPWREKKLKSLLSTATVLRTQEFIRSARFPENSKLKLFEGTPEYFKNAVLAVKDAIKKETSIKRFGRYVKTDMGIQSGWGLAAVTAYNDTKDKEFPETNTVYQTEEDALAARREGVDYEVFEVFPDIKYEIVNDSDERVVNMIFPTFERALVFMLDSIKCPEWEIFVEKEELATDEDSETSFKVQEFQRLLEKAIAGRKKGEFASLIGITPQHLSYLLNNTSPKRPTTDTLIKIAQNSTLVTVKELYRACGYVEDSAPVIHNQKSDYDSLPTKEWIKTNIQTAKEWFKEFLEKKKGSRFDIKSCEDVFDFLYRQGDNRIRLNISEPAVCTSEDGIYEESRLLTITWVHGSKKFPKGVMKMDVILFGHTSSHGMWYLEGCSMKPTVIAEAIPERKAYYEHMNDVHADDGINIFELSEFYEYKRNKQHLDAEKKLLDAIFGKAEMAEGERMETVSVNGPGFKTDEISEDTFIEFLKNHRESFSSTPERKEFCRKVIDSGYSPEELYLSLSTGEDPVHSTSGNTRMCDIIAEIIRNETGLKGVEYWESEDGDKEDEEYENYSSILINTECGDVISEKKKIDEAMIGYAKELGLHEYRWCFYYMKARSDEYAFAPVKF